MTDKFYPINIEHLLRIILAEYQENKSIFGIPEALFFNPAHNKQFKVNQFNKLIVSPFGVAAGPHSQMAQNIIGAWLMGARYIELKTIQTLDELEIAKPCIDMQDEGYNCEWSQELRIKQSFDEYLNAWIIIHILNHKFGFGKSIETIFNMSVGYNLEGIMQDNVQWFFDKMSNCSAEKSERMKQVKAIYPLIDEIEIPVTISDNITLSTMHGCPANEIEDIARYLLEEKHLHTYVKLNPTLLGPDRLRETLNTVCGFKTNVPDQAFEHDLKYTDAVNIINSLTNIAKGKNLIFGLKLTNTLESVNNKPVFGDAVDMMYMSGRALHPISVQVAHKLQEEFEGKLELSFSAGADAFNISDLLACGFKTITVCSDLLKPGGYMRMNQYFEKLQQTFATNNSINIEDWIIKSASNKDIRIAALSNLRLYKDKVMVDKRYKREYIQQPDIKTKRELDYFDCISAPCIDTCATNQAIPEYMFFTANKQFENAYKTILHTNPFPAITGMVCDHLCQNKCTRVNYDNPLLIREIKRFISEQKTSKTERSSLNGKTVAIIGAGPSGMVCAYYLALAGFKVDVYEQKSKSGGMVQYAIPGFRLTQEAIDKDFNRVTDLGVQVHYDYQVDADAFERMRKERDYIYIAPGAQLSAPFSIEGINSKGVLDSLQFLFNAKAGKDTDIGQHVVIIGGGNTAMDAARTAYRLVGDKGTVTIVYRRTINEMPADQGEIKAVLEEGMQIVELTAPEKVIQEDGVVKGLLCSRMQLTGVDKSGRPKPEKIEGSEFAISCDTIIPAVGQSLDIRFMPVDLLQANTITYKTKLKNVYIGGDALRGASTAINAIGDGRKTAEKILADAFPDKEFLNAKADKNLSKKDLILKRAKRIYGEHIDELDINDRKNFKLVSHTLTENSAIKEATRCLYCDEICNICTTVCPNFANYGYEVVPKKYHLQMALKNDNGEIEILDDKPYEVRQQYQILNIANFCNECGNCNTFCPTQSAPYQKKPKFYLTPASFNQAEEGYLMAKLPERTNIIYKYKGNIRTLSLVNDEYVYETDHFLARFTTDGDFKLKEVRFLTPCAKKVEFHEALEMSILMHGAERLY